MLLLLLSLLLLLIVIRILLALVALAIFESILSILLWRRERALCKSTLVLCDEDSSYAVIMISVFMGDEPCSL